MGVSLPGEPYMQTYRIKRIFVNACTIDMDSLRFLTLKILNLLGARRVLAL